MPDGAVYVGRPSLWGNTFRSTHRADTGSAAGRRGQAGRGDGLTAREQAFSFSCEVSLEFLAQEPAQAQKWLDARLAQIAKQEYATGPRGGRYKLWSEPVPWKSNVDPFWHPTTATYWTRRWGRYIRPGRVKMPMGGPTFGTFTIPVRDDQALLPDGHVIRTSSQYIDVPVPPAFVE
jgi:hypothetical protein